MTRTARARRLHSGGASAVAPALASAQSPAQASAQASAQAPAGSNLVTPYGEYFLVGGGVTDYANSTVKDLTDTGGTWGLRLGFGSRYFVGGEIAYVGSYRDSNAIGSDLETNFSISDRTALALGKSDLVFTIPFGGGVTVAYDHFLFDTRFTYRQTIDEWLIRDSNGSDASLSSWGVTASVGYEF